MRRPTYGLPQAGEITNKFLKVNLATHGYFELPHTPGLWQHTTRPISFSLMVDDFGVKYTNRADADHLISTLQNTMKYQKTGHLDYTTVSQ